MTGRARELKRGIGFWHPTFAGSRESNGLQRYR